MPAAFIAALRYLAQLFVVEIVGKLATYWKERQARKEKQQANQDKAQKSVEPLQKAQTAEEIDKASDNALDGF